MDRSAVTGFFAVAKRPQTWLNVLFHWLAFPLGLFYFIFLVVGLSLGFGLLVVWVGIPILLVVAGAWWLFGSFERIQAMYLLGADVGPAPRSWEAADGIWAKLKAHFGNGATWRDLAYLFAKLPLGIASFVLAVTAVSVVFWLAAFPAAWYWDFTIVDWGSTADGGYTPTWWQAVLAVPAAILAFFAVLHVLNGWGWVCARWAELLFGKASARPEAGTAHVTPGPLVSTQPEPLVSTGPAPLVSTAPAPPMSGPANIAPAPQAWPNAGPDPAPQAQSPAPSAPRPPVRPPQPAQGTPRPPVRPPRAPETQEATPPQDPRGPQANRDGRGGTDDEK